MFSPLESICIALSRSWRGVCGCPSVSLLLEPVQYDINMAGMEAASRSVVIAMLASSRQEQLLLEGATV